MNPYLSFAIKYAGDKAGYGVCSDVTSIRLVLQHVVTEVNVAICWALSSLQSKELKNTNVVFLINVDIDKQHLKST